MSDMPDTDDKPPLTDTPDNTDSPREVTEGTVIPPEDQPGEWLAPPLAALRLGVSERTLWRHVNANRYSKRTVAGRAEILVPGERDSAPDTGASGSGLAVRQTPDALTLAVIEELREQRKDDRDRLTALTAENRTLAERAARAEAIAAERAAELERERQETKRLRGRSLWDILRGK